MTRDIPRNPKTQSNFRNITQTNEGLVQIQFDNSQKDTLSKRSFSRSNSFAHSHISPFDYIIEQPQTSRVSTSYFRPLNNFPGDDEERDSSLEEPMEDLRVHRNGIVENNNEPRFRKIETMSDIDV